MSDYYPNSFYKDLIATRRVQNILYNQMLDNRALTNGRIGMLEGVVSYCNEKEKTRGAFLLKCNPDCKHNAPL